MAPSLMTFGFSSDDGVYWRRSFSLGELAVLWGEGGRPTMLVVTNPDGRERAPVPFNTAGREERFASVLGGACAVFDDDDVDEDDDDERVDLGSIVHALEQIFEPERLAERAAAIAAVTAEAAYEDDPDAEFFGPVDEADFVGWPCAPAVMKAMAEALGTVGFLEQRRGARFVYRSPYVDFAVDVDRRRGALRLTARDRDFPQPNIWWVRVEGRDHGRMARTLFRLFEETASLDIDRLDNELRVAFPDVAELSHEGVVIVDARRADGLY